MNLLIGMKLTYLLDNRMASTFIVLKRGHKRHIVAVNPIN